MGGEAYITQNYLGQKYVRCPDCGACVFGNDKDDWRIDTIGEQKAEKEYFNTNHIVAVGKFNKNPQHSIVYTTEKENEYLVKESLEEVVQRIEEEATKPRHFGQSCIEIIENAANSNIFKSMSPETEIHTKSLTVDGIQVFLNWFVNTEKDTI